MLYGHVLYKLHTIKCQRLFQIFKASKIIIKNKLKKVKILFEIFISYFMNTKLLMFIIKKTFLTSYFSVKHAE